MLEGLLLFSLIQTTKVTQPIILPDRTELIRKYQHSNEALPPVDLKFQRLDRYGFTATGTFLNPITIDYVITGYFAEWRGSHAHGGIDLAAPTGTSVRAADAGKVTFSDYSDAYGNLIIIDHLNGFETYYAHLSGLGTRVGTKVPKGRAIGWVGSTGRSSGPHLHFEIRKKGQAVNPRDYIRF